MTDRMLGVLALAGFAAYLAFLIFNVPSLPLTLVLVFVIGLAAWDFWTTLRPKRNARSSAKDEPKR
jgi:hypothetical protein